MSSWVAAMHSASAEIGTHTSVVSAPLPGRIARAASIAPWRACHSRRRSASSAAQAKSPTAELGGDLGDLARLGRDLGLASRPGTRGTASGRPRTTCSKWRLIASICSSSASSIRATGIPYWPTAHHALHGGVDRRERALRGGRRLGDRVQAQRRLADQPERALRADHQPRQVIAGRGLARPRVGAHDPPAGVDHGEREHVLAHRPVADGGRARGAGRDHPADRRVGARVDGEEHALGPQPRVELRGGSTPACRRRRRGPPATGGRSRSSRACRRRSRRRARRRGPRARCPRRTARAAAGARRRRRTIAAASSIERGHTTASGRASGWNDSSWPCWASTSAPVSTRSAPSRSRSARVPRPRAASGGRRRDAALRPQSSSSPSAGLERGSAGYSAW